MLASITPLGERSRGFSWNVTAAWFAVGALLAGGLAGAALGALGALIPGGETWRGFAVAAVLAAAVLLDATPLRLPSVRRQVNEDWLGRYRGWVYGVSFGAQLGLGVTTIVTSAAIYAGLLCALVGGRPGTGAVIGLAAGATRALTLLPARGVTDPVSLVALHRRLRRIEPSVRRVVVGLELCALAAAVGLVA